MKRLALLAVSLVLALLATIGWPARYALIACVVVGFLAYVIGAVAWPRKPELWTRREVRVGEER